MAADMPLDVKARQLRVDIAEAQSDAHDLYSALQVSPDTDGNNDASTYLGMVLQVLCAAVRFAEKAEKALELEKKNG